MVADSILSRSAAKLYGTDDRQERGGLGQKRSGREAATDSDGETTDSRRATTDSDRRRQTTGEQATGDGRAEIDGDDSKTEEFGGHRKLSITTAAPWLLPRKAWIVDGGAQDL
jgi:hypothetical protein